MIDKKKGLRVCAALAAPVIAHLLSLLLWTAMYPGKLQDAVKADSGLSSHKAGGATKAQAKRWVKKTGAVAHRELITLGAFGIASLLGFFRWRLGLIFGFGAGIGITLLYFILQPVQLAMVFYLVIPFSLWVSGYGFGGWVAWGVWRKLARR